MRMQIFAARSPVAVSEDNVQAYSREIQDFEVCRMWQGYYAGKPAMRKAFEKFAAQWQDSWHNLASPQAGIVKWDKEELTKSFVSRFPDGQLKRNIAEHCVSGYAVVWTIGRELEEKSFELAGERATQAMFLDIAGTLILASMRAEIRKFLTSREFQDGGDKYLLGEYIPEICGKDGTRDPRLSLIAAPWLKIFGSRRPDFTFHKSGVMSPLKTQCSMFFAGESRIKKTIAFNTIPCSGCTGSKCLVAQFNGCHLPKESQTWLNRSV